MRRLVLCHVKRINQATNDVSPLKLINNEKASSLLKQLASSGKCGGQRQQAQSYNLRTC